MEKCHLCSRILTKLNKSKEKGLCVNCEANNNKRDTDGDISIKREYKNDKIT